MSNTKISCIILFLVLLSSYWLHIPHINKDIQGVHDWRQCQTMWNVRNFARHDNNIFNPRVSRLNGSGTNIKRYEFPVFQWVAAQLIRVFGEHIFLIRSYVYLLGMLVVFGMFLLVKELLQDNITALLTSVLFSFTPLFYYYTINPLPDIFALAAAIYYIFFITQYHKTYIRQHLFVASLFLLLATLAKLPYIMFSIISIIRIARDLRLTQSRSKAYVSALTQLVVVSPALVWYAFVIPTWTGNPVLDGGLSLEVDLQKYLDIGSYHIKEMFPNRLLSKSTWLFFLVGFFLMFKNVNRFSWVVSIFFITVLYLAVEFIPIGKVHDYYMLPFLVWMFPVVGIGIHYVQKKWPKAIYVIASLSLFSVFDSIDKTTSYWDASYSCINEDVFKYSIELKAAVPDQERCIILNDVSGYIFSYRIDKMGYVFCRDEVKLTWIKDLIKNHGVKYMYSDSEKINSSTDFKPYVEEIILERGSIKVYKLKLP